MSTASEGKSPSARPLTPDHYMLVQTCSHARYILYINIPNLCDNFVKKVVSAIRKCQLQPRNPIGALPQTPIR